LKSYKSFEGLAGVDLSLAKIDRTKELSEEEFLQILSENCKNFSFSNDVLWRSKAKKYDLEIFTPNPRNAKPLAFPTFFNKIEKDPNFPVVRKMSLIGGTDKDILKKLVGDDIYQVIPFDGSEIVFCPIVDLWAMRDKVSPMDKVETVGQEPVGEEHFIKVTYDKDFKIPFDELEKMATELKLRGSRGVGYEFFTSSPCLLIHESKIDWLKGKVFESRFNMNDVILESKSVGLKFAKQPQKKGAKTDTYNVSKSGKVIGLVKWSSRMRGYAFLPTSDCESKIKDFVKDLMKKRRESK